MARTLVEIDSRIPDALRVAFGMRRPVCPATVRGQQDDAANLAAVLLAPRDDGDPMDVDDDGDPMDVDEAEPELEEDLGMVLAASYIKDHDEDAHFVHAVAGVIGVADGVGSYRLQGVDASAFSRALMHNAEAQVATAVPGTRFCPLALLKRAYQRTVAARTPAASTAAIVSLAGRTLKWAFVGDSGFVVLRDGMILLRSVPQQHHFNCPYQLSSRRDSNRIADADVGEVAAEEGDIVILGTDGLFDNVFDNVFVDEIERIVRMGTALGFSPENMAEVMAAFAYEASTCTDRDSPYSCLVRAQPGKSSRTGGKPDDITVVVVYIVSSARLSLSR